MRINGYSLPLVQHPSFDHVPVYPHQAAMIDAWDEHSALLLVTKTGSGKTAATVLSMALNRNKLDDNCVVFVYPTNELIQDQERSILAWLNDRLSIRTRVITPENADAPIDDAEIELVRIDAERLDWFCQEWTMYRWGKPDKGRALERLLNVSKPRIVLINPDILYLVYSLRYGQAQNSIAALQAFQTVVFDEFHLYQGLELARILFLIHAARMFGSFERVVLLSATPHPEVRAWIDRLLNPHEITMEIGVEHAAIGKRDVAFDVDLSLLPRGHDSVEVAKRKLIELLPDIKRLHSRDAQDGNYVPVVVILNSVVKAIELEQNLLDEGISKEKIVPIRGRSDRAIRKLDSKSLIVIGTSAIEVGIDFQCDYLIFEAGDVAAFMQRFGRLGRHIPGKAFLIGTLRECQAIEGLPQTISRSEFEEGVAQIYPEADARAWFTGTTLGTFAALAQAYSIRNRIFRDREKATDSPEVKQQIYTWLDKATDAYANQMGLRKQVKEAKGLFRGWVRGRRPWVGHYLQTDSFRSGLPSIPIHDRSEAKRRGYQYAVYEADFKSVFSRATEVKKNGDLYQIAGYGKFEPLYVNKSFTDEKRPGIILSTADYPNLMIKRRGELESWSHLMSRAETDHIFVYVPYDEVRYALDWRLPTFHCGSRRGEYVLAFDGDALLLKEIWKRQASRR